MGVFLMIMIHKVQRIEQPHIVTAFVTGTGRIQVMARMENPGILIRNIWFAKTLDRHQIPTGFLILVFSKTLNPKFFCLWILGIIILILIGIFARSIFFYKAPSPINSSRRFTVTNEYDKTTNTKSTIDSDISHSPKPPPPVFKPKNIGTPISKEIISKARKLTLRILKYSDANNGKIPESISSLFTECDIDESDLIFKFDDINNNIILQYYPGASATSDPNTVIFISPSLNPNAHRFVILLDGSTFFLTEEEYLDVINLPNLKSSPAE